MTTRRQPIIWEDYDVSATATANRLVSVRALPRARNLSTPSLVSAIGRGIGWFVVLAVGILVLCQLSVIGLLDTPQDQHPSGSVSRYGEVSHAN